MVTQISRWARIEAKIKPSRTVKPYKKNNPNCLAHFGRLPSEQKQFCYRRHYDAAPCFVHITFY